MRGLDPEVVETVWQAVAARLPEREDTHPLGCHNPRIADRVCFEGILIRLVTGCSWVSAERLMRGVVSDTTPRARRDEWIEAGVFESLVTEAIDAYDRIVGLDLSETAVDGSQHKAPCGGRGTGRNPTDRGKLGWKWSLMTDRNGIPVSWAITGANRHDTVLFEPTLAPAARHGFLHDVETLHLDRGYDTRRVRDTARAYGIDDLNCARTRPPGAAHTKTHVPLGKRWTIERTNSWLSNYGQLRCNTDRHPHHRLAQIALAVTVLLIPKPGERQTGETDTPQPPNPYPRTL